MHQRRRDRDSLYARCRPAAADGYSESTGGSLCPCDPGIEFGALGIGKDDIQSVTFTLSDKSESLDASLFGDEVFGARATSVADRNRAGSSKLMGVVAQPSTACS
jgi:hypothetical protein